MLGRDELESLTVTSALGGRLARGLIPLGGLTTNDLVALLAGALRSTIIAGGAVGDHVVAGIAVADALRSVLSMDIALTDHVDHSHDLVSSAGAPAANAVTMAANSLRNASAGTLTIEAAAADGVQDYTTPLHVRTWAVADLTAEFAITAVNTINNAGGTNTTGRMLIVVYEDLTP